MTPALKRSLHAAGIIASIAGVAFVALKLRGYSAQLDLSGFDALTGAILIALACVYGLANLLLGAAWWHLLDFLGAHAGRGWAIRTYGLAQIAKYAPGHIFHFLGRQTLGMAAGLSGRALAKSVPWELGLLAVTGALFSLGLLPLLLPALPLLPPSLLLLIGLCAAGVIIRRWLAAPAAHAYGLYAIFLLCSGFVFLATLVVVAPDFELTATSILTVCCAYVIAWLAGLITPGAPAGIGVREVVLIFLLGTTVGKGELLLAVALGRAITIGGDLLYFAGCLCKKENRKQESP